MTERRALAALTVAVLAAGCGSAPTIVPSRDFDRPTDMVFVCMGAFTASAPSTPDAGGPDGGTTAAAGESSLVSGRPMNHCHPIGQFDPVTDTQHRTFAFVTSSGSGQLSVIDADSWKLVDLDPAIAAYNTLPLGELPEQISASDDGCRLVTANHGSCDLSFVDPSALLAPTLGAPCSGGDCPAQPIQRVVPVAVKGDGTRVRLDLAPQEVQFLPQNISALDGQDNLCSTGENAASAPNGWLPPSAGSAQPWEALVTFPSCDLIALVDLPSGEIRDSVRVVRSGDGKSIVLAPQGTDPSCPVSDCGQRVAASAAADGGGASDAGATDAGAGGAGADEAGVGDGSAGEAGVPPTDGAAGAGGTPSKTPIIGPGSIAIAPGGGTAYVGLTNAPYVDLADQPLVVALDIAPGGKLTASSAAPGGILLHEGARGVNRVRLSVNPYQANATPAQYLGTFVRSSDPKPENATPVDRKYLYVIARDGTLRVVQVPDSSSGSPVTTAQECETNANPLNLPPGYTSADMLANAACVPVDPTHRRPFVSGPGIRLPTAPVDVMAADIRLEQTDLPLTAVCDQCAADSLETTVDGAYAWVLSASGGIYLVNLDPVKRAYQIIPDVDPDPMTHVPAQLTYVTEAPPPVNALRDRNVITFTRALDVNSGPPRLDVVINPPASGPRIEGIWARGTLNNAATVSADYIQTNVLFPDSRAVNPQTWNAVWEGTIVGPRVSAVVAAIDPLQSRLEDGGADFCAAGVLAGDTVTLTGCVADGDCGFSKVCLHGNNGVLGAAGLPINGLCVDPHQKDALAKDCSGMLDTVRRYDIVKATTSAFTLQPRRDELIRSDRTPCSVKTGMTDLAAVTRGDGMCKDADGKVIDIVPNDCADDSLDPTTKAFECVADTDAAGVTKNRCLQRCCTPGSTEGCRAGRICVDYGGGSDHYFCADAAPVTTECVNQYMSYQVGVGRSFLLSGSQIGVPVTGRSLADGTCDPHARENDPTINPQLVTRIPIDAPACKNIPDNILDSRCDPQVGTWPCDDMVAAMARPPAGVFPNEQQLPDSTGTASTLLHQVLQAVPQPATPEVGLVCSFMGGPNDSDPLKQEVPLADRPRHQHVLVRNTELAFLMTNLEQAPVGTLSIPFDVHGGFRPQAVVSPATIDVSLPSRILVGPFDSQAIPPGNKAGDGNPYELPYVFVIDRRRLGTSQSGGPTRGQILRIHPLTSIPGLTGRQPFFQDHSTSNNLFPIE